MQLSVNSGAVVSSRYFKGAKCLRLQTGQGVKMLPGQFPFRNGNWFRTWQFAVNTDAASLALPSGTVLGHFRVDYANASETSLVPDTSIVLRVVVNAAGGANLVCVNNGSILGVLNGATDNWLLVTLIAMNKVTATTLLDSTEPWECYDPLTGTNKGPQPNPAPIPITTGVHIYVDAPSLATVHTVLTRAAHLGSTGATRTAPAQS